MDEVIGDLDPVHRGEHRRRVEDVAAHDVRPGEAARQPFGEACNAANLVTVVRECGHEETADVAGGTGYENAHVSDRAGMYSSRSHVPGNETVNHQPLAAVGLERTQKAHR